MREQEFEIKGGAVTYRESKGHMKITGYRGQILEAVLPEMIHGKYVEEIEKKSFLGCKSLRKIRLPENCAAVGDWAFANCSNLETVELPCREIEFGQGVFKEDKSLKNIFVASVKAESSQTAALLAAAVSDMDASYLLVPKEAGTKEWIEKWDLAMGAILREEDEEGYQKMVLCGEEDLSINLDDFLAEKRRKKARLCFLRLLNPSGLPDERKEELEAYIKEHTKGCDSEASWEVILKEHGEERDYFELFTALGCVTEENFEAILADFGERYAPMKSYLMEYHGEKLQKHDFFDTLSL